MQATEGVAALTPGDFSSLSANSIRISRAIAVANARNQPLPKKKKVSIDAGIDTQVTAAWWWITTAFCLLSVAMFLN